jgi:hypothetical protein
MIVNLATQIRDYAAAVDADQEPMGLDEIAQARLGTEGVQPLNMEIRRPVPGWVSAVSAAAVVILFGGAAFLLSPTASDVPVADTVVATTVGESTPPSSTPTTSYQQRWHVLTEDIPEDVESGTVTTSLGSARWVHLNSSEYLLPSLGSLGSNPYQGFMVSDHPWGFWTSLDGITWRPDDVDASYSLAWSVPYVDGAYTLAWFINTDPLEMETSEGGPGSKVDLTGLVPPFHARFSGPDDQVDQRLLVLGYGDGGDYASYLSVPWHVESVVSLFGTSETLFAYVVDPDSNQVSVWRSNDGYDWTESGALHEQLGVPASSGLRLTVLPAVDPMDDPLIPMRNQVVVATTPSYGSWESTDGVSWTRAPDGSPGDVDLIRLESGWFATDGDAWWMHVGDSWVSLAGLGMEHPRDGCQIVPRGAGHTTFFFSTGTCGLDISQQSTTDLWIISLDS